MIIGAMSAESQIPTPSAAMTSELGGFAGWQLSANCPRCRILRRVLIDDLMRQVAPQTPVKDVVTRLRCQHCGTPPNWVRLADGVEGAGARVQRIQLVEPPPISIATQGD